MGDVGRLPVTRAVYVRATCENAAARASRRPIFRMSGKTETSHEPTADELEHAEGGELQHPGDLPNEVHGADDHGDTHGHDDHAHASEALGPIDTAAWGAFLVGIAAGLAVVLCLVLTVAVIGSGPAL